MLSVDDLYNTVSNYISPKPSGFGINPNATGGTGINPSPNARPYGQLDPSAPPASPIAYAQTPQPKSPDDRGFDRMLAGYANAGGGKYVPPVPGGSVAPLPTAYDPSQYTTMFASGDNNASNSALNQFANNALGYNNNSSVLSNLGKSAMSYLMGS